MSILHSRRMTYLSLGIMLLIFVLIILFTAGSVDMRTDVDNRSTIIEGRYSLDGSDWQDTLPRVMVNEDFHELTIKGKLSQPLAVHDQLIMSVDNVWFKLKSNGKVIGTNYRADDTVFGKTPGYNLCYIPAELVEDSEDMELYIMYPYELLSSKNLRDFYDMYIGNEATVYELLFQHKAPTILLCILLCFFGLFSFPIAGIVLGKIDYRYLSFAMLCFFAGIFILAQTVYSYLPLWIHDPVKSMAAATITSHICMISSLIYIKVSLKKSVNKLIGNIIIAAASLLTAIALILHYTGVSDLYAGKPFMLIFGGVCAIILTVCLISEISIGRNAFIMLTSMIPVLASLFLEAVNEFFYFTDFPLYETGMALTLVNQIVILIIDLHRQYQESIRYQQMQKELYEAKVSLMVSQIQPHFLYNSLTSIAMMCTKDPKTARTATINFADYLRGNMNSLKQKAPVPFPQELEHLKKYLMLEQMRFGDMLRIEYDIQATDFVIPLLSVQPLVENAVKHGVGMKEDGGTVTIATREEDDCYKVIITDDGVGFDTSVPIEDDGRSHVGMENVRQRLKELCNADVNIESEIGKGTVATIRIPKAADK
ncbi:MAG: histidine kinase [Ruminococcus sp.]|nr:histidine kinase [Ruminococcus sp.]